MLCYYFGITLYSSYAKIRKNKYNTILSVVMLCMIFEWQFGFFFNFGYRMFYDLQDLQLITHNEEYTPT